MIAVDVNLRVREERELGEGGVILRDAAECSEFFCREKN